MKTVENSSTSPTIWIPTKNAVSCELEGEIVLLDLQSGTYFGLNKVGAEIWNQLTLGKSTDEIQQYLAGRYAVSAERCRRDVLALIGQLREKGLVRAEDEDEAPV